MTDARATVYEFDGFRFDALRNRLETADGRDLQLKPKAAEVLLALISRPGELVSKDELMEAVWPDSFVEEGNLLVNLSHLRKALGDSADNPRFIVNVPGKGYRFVGEVRNATEVPAAVRGEDPTTHATARFLRNPALIFLAVLVVLVVIVSASFYFNRSAAEAASFRDFHITKLTTSGTAAAAAISPDGKYAAYVLKEKDSQGVWLKQLGTSGGDVQIITPEAPYVDYHALVFSPDGRSLFFLKSGRTGPIGLYHTSTLGGPVNQIAEDVDSIPGISPDGETLAFIRGLPDDNVVGLFAVGADGGGERRVAAIHADDAFVFDAQPAWSLDGKRIICAVKKQDENGRYNGLVSVEASSGKIDEVASPRFIAISHTAWLPGMKGLLISATTAESPDISQVWLVGYPQGTARRITNDLNDYRDLSVTADGKTFIALTTRITSNIWRATLSDTGRGEQITTTNQDGNEGLAFTHAGDIVYTSRGGQTTDLWLYSKDGVRRQLTSGAGNNTQPAVSPDGSTVAFVSDRDGLRHIWLIDTEGRTLGRLTNGNDDGAPSWSPDGKRIAYRSYGEGNPYIYTIDAAGGSPFRVTDKISGRPEFSPDGTKILTTCRPVALSLPKISIFPAGGGDAEVTFELASPLMHWADQGRSILFISGLSDRNMNIWRQVLDPKVPPTKISSFTDKRIFWFDISSDGKALAYARGETLKDVVLISDNSK